MQEYVREGQYDALMRGLRGSPGLLQIVVGPRQVGKTTLALQILRRWNGASLYETADGPDTPSLDWVREQWEKIRRTGRESREDSLLILDEVQKIPRWSELIKKLFDEDRRSGRAIRVILLGSSALLVQKGLTESLAGRFELHRHSPWSFGECREYFNLTLQEYLYFGGYPAGLHLRGDEERWQRHIRDALIETVLSKDLLLLTAIRKPALLRQTFGMAVAHPAEVLSYQKMLGTLQDAGNTTTIASYLRLLSQAFLLTPLERWSGSRLRQRGSQPKIIVFDNGIVSAMAGRKRAEVQKDTAMWGRMVENAVGAQLHFLAQELGGELFYWRKRKEEVDFVFKQGQHITAIEVKTGRLTAVPPSLAAFCRTYKGSQALLISGEATNRGDLGTVRTASLETFFSNPIQTLEDTD